MEILYTQEPLTKTLKRNYLPLKKNWSDITSVDDFYHIDYIELPQSLGGLKFFPNYSKLCSHFDISFKVFHFFKEQNITLQKLSSYNYMMNHLCTENNLKKNFQDNFTTEPEGSTILEDYFGSLIFIHSRVKIVFINNNIYMESIDNDTKILLTPQVNYICCGDKTIVFKIESTESAMTLKSKMKCLTKSEEAIYKLENSEFTANRVFKNSETNLNLSINTKIKPNGNVEECYNKNGLLVGSVYDNSTNTSILISQCMMNDSTSGVRYRGTYKEIKSDGQIVKKSLLNNDELIYNKEDGQVLIDKINTKSIKDGIIIGWKIAKSLNGEKRIIKLGISSDAKTVKAVDREYFHTRGKERCNKAFVMDIQYAKKEEESVVPNELVAYSYVYKDDMIGFEYKVGTEVIPDSFDENENESCTNGIHYYQDRNTIFEVYFG